MADASRDNCIESRSSVPRSKKPTGLDYRFIIDYAQVSSKNIKHCLHVVYSRYFSKSKLSHRVQVYYIPANLEFIQYQVERTDKLRNQVNYNYPIGIIIMNIFPYNYFPPSGIQYSIAYLPILNRRDRCDILYSAEIIHGYHAYSGRINSDLYNRKRKKQSSL